MSTDRTPSALGLRIAHELLDGYAKHGLADDEMIRNAALLVDRHMEIDRLERDIAMRDIAMREMEENEGRHGQRAYGPDHE